MFVSVGDGAKGEKINHKYEEFKGLPLPASHGDPYREGPVWSQQSLVKVLDFVT